MFLVRYVDLLKVYLKEKNVKTRQENLCASSVSQMSGLGCFEPRHVVILHEDVKTRQS